MTATPRSPACPDLAGILPELTPSEALEVSMIASVAGALVDGRLVEIEADAIVAE